MFNKGAVGMFSEKSLDDFADTTTYTAQVSQIKESQAERRIVAALEELKKGMKKKSTEILLDKEKAWWVSQYNSIFPKEGCCKIQDACCKCACDEILNKTLPNPTSTSASMLDVIVSGVRTCKEKIKDAKGNYIKKDGKYVEQYIQYSTSGLIGDATAFNKAIQTIDTSLIVHKLPIMVEVQHPYKNSNYKWYYKCSSNHFSATNHFIVIIGKDYDENKQMWFYYFYEVGTRDDNKGHSEDNKLWINIGEHLIKGSVAITDYENYYVVTGVRRNNNKTYTYK
jgi:hypothetical protein